MRLVALIIFVPGRASNSATVSSYEDFKLCIYKMRLVALIMFVPGRAWAKHPKPRGFGERRINQEKPQQ